MAVYKVPQDVEADDKLIGPFSFRQFIYLIIVAISIALAWGLSRLFLPLLIIPLPIIIFFGALALPLRKDQPMEIYLAAIVSFYLKPRKHFWQPDGIQSLVEVTAPKIIEPQRVKDLSQAEAERRLSYLAQVVDSGGWAVRGVAAPVQNTPMNDDLYFEAQQAPDILDESTGVARNIDTRLAQSDAQRRQDMINRMQQSARQTQQAPQPTPVAQSQPTQAPYTPPDPYANLGGQTVSYNPYPSMRQSVIQPLSGQPTPQAAPAIQQPVTSTSNKPVSPDIISLASNPDLSIETIQREADRISKKEEGLPEDEVVISLH